MGIACGLALAVALAVPAQAPARKFNAGNWDPSAQELVVREGLLTDAPGGAFEGGQRLSGSEFSGR